MNTLSKTHDLLRIFEYILIHEKIITYYSIIFLNVFEIVSILASEDKYYLVSVVNLYILNIFFVEYVFFRI